MSKKSADILKLILSLGIGIALVWLTTRQLTEEQIEKIKGVFANANYFWVVLGPAVGMLSNVVRAERWKILLNSIGYYPKRSNLIYAVFVMYAGNLIFPRLGEITRCSLIYKTDNVPIEKSIGTMILERSIDMITMLLMGAMLFVVDYGTIFDFFNNTFGNYFAEKIAVISWFHVLLAIVVLLAVGAGFFYFLYSNREKKYFSAIWKILQGFIDGLLSIFKLKQPLLFIFYSILIWVMYWYMLYLCYGALTETAGLSAMSAVAVVFFGAFAFIISQGGVGAYPPTVGTVLMLYGVPYEIGFGFGWLVWGLQTAAVIICGVIAFMLISRRFTFSNTTTDAA